MEQFNEFEEYLPPPHDSVTLSNISLREAYRHSIMPSLPEPLLGPRIP